MVDSKFTVNQSTIYKADTFLFTFEATKSSDVRTNLLLEVSLYHKMITECKLAVPVCKLTLK